MLTFNTFASAMSFRRGYCVPRCVVQLTAKQQRTLSVYGGRYGVCTTSYAKRHALRVVYPA